MFYSINFYLNFENVKEKFYRNLIRLKNIKEPFNLYNSAQNIVLNIANNYNIKGTVCLTNNSLVEICCDGTFDQLELFVSDLEKIPIYFELFIMSKSSLAAHDYSNFSIIYPKNV